MDEEENEEIREADAASITRFKTSVQEALRQATICHSMKALDIATQMLRNSLQKLEQHYDVDPDKNYSASLKLCSSDNRNSMFGGDTSSKNSCRFGYD